MQILLKIYNIFGLFLLMVVLRICAGGMEKKWMKMMHKAHAHHQDSKGISLKAIPIPIPILVKEKGETHPEETWQDESKDMFWKMMMIKMMKGDKGKGCDKGCPTMCCPQTHSDGWPKVMKAIKAMKAMKGMHWKQNAPCCHFKMKGGPKAGKDCNNMKMGWNAPTPMCCNTNKGGWHRHPPDEPDYYYYDYY